MKRFLSVILMLCILAQFPLQAAAQVHDANTNSEPSDYFISVMRLAFTDQDRSKIITPSGEDVSAAFFHRFAADYQQNTFVNMNRFYKDNNLSLEYTFPEEPSAKSYARGGSSETVSGKKAVHQYLECSLTRRENCEVGYYFHYSYVVNNNEGIILDADPPTFEMLYTSFDSAVSWGDAAIEYQNEIRRAVISPDDTSVRFYLDMEMAVYSRMITGVEPLALNYRYPVYYEYTVYA